MKTFWRTDGWTEYGWIVLKLAEPEDGGDLIIDRIEFNNDRSAFVEIFASNESPEFESQFCVLKPVFSTLSPNASRDMLMGGLHRKHFQVKAKDFATKDNTDQQHSAKYLKFVCSQPFNKVGISVFCVCFLKCICISCSQSPLAWETFRCTLILPVRTLDRWTRARPAFGMIDTLHQKAHINLIGNNTRRRMTLRWPMLDAKNSKS